MCLTLEQMLLLRQTVLTHSAVDTRQKLREQWHRINWKDAFRQVKSLQRRIVAAIKEERWGKVKSLQWILTHSFYAKVIAIRRVTENKGSRTCGIDGVMWNTTQSRWKAISKLTRKGYKAKAVRRVKIPKDNGQDRMLGIPTMQDRAMQALYLLALEPVAETLADIHSYGFRPYRSCHDAIAQGFIVLSKKNAPKYILEGDIKSCFDKISHQWILDNILLDKKILNQWLKAGAIENKSWFPSEEGTPQGSIISPTIANIVLDGMSKTIDDALGIKKWGKRRYKNPHKVHFIRYADDWIVTADNKEILEKQVKPIIKSFLKQRGLELAEHKTVITSVDKGFDFLGQNFRKYNGKLLIKPSRKSIKKLLGKVRATIKEMNAMPTCVLIARINTMTKGWAMYHRYCVAKKTFSLIDNRIWKAIWKWCVRRHPNKGKKWIALRYFMFQEGSKWTFFGKENNKTYYLYKVSKVPIIRYVKIKSEANPFTREDEPYFEKHLQMKMLNTWKKRQKLATIFRRQKGKCVLCEQRITKESGWHIHHKLERYKGGTDKMDNLVMLHPICHRQVHYWNIRFDGDVPKRASEFA